MDGHVAEHLRTLGGHIETARSVASAPAGEVVDVDTDAAASARVPSW